MNLDLLNLLRSNVNKSLIILPLRIVFKKYTMVLEQSDSFFIVFYSIS
jgi:Flp pilus assembly CpaE family ATPase